MNSFWNSLDSRTSAATLFDVSQMAGKDLRQLVEPALADWNYEGIRPVWYQRIASVKTPRRDLILAIQGLGRQRDAAALESLLNLAMTREHPADVRLAAARAAGQVTNEGLEPKSDQLLARDRESILERLCAVAIITRHQSEPAIKSLQTLSTDPEPTVTGAALRALYAHDPTLVLQLVESALRSLDANVRRVGIETYLKLPTPERIRTLSLRMNDPHPQLRGLVREAFFSLSKDQSLDATIRQSTVAILAGDDWRGQEQAALLLGALDEESVAVRLIELLDANRPEVKLAVAWSLKTIAVGSTATPILAFSQRRTDNTKAVDTLLDDQLAHLFEFLGTQKFDEAIPLLLVYVPKTPIYGIRSRSAAVWALGLIQEGHVNEPLAKQLMERVLDTMSSPPEALDVRRTAILTLGRLRAKTQLPGLKELLGEQVDNELIDLAIRWAVYQISGELLPIAPLPASERSGWFLEPAMIETKPK